MMRREQLDQVPCVLQASSVRATLWGAGSSVVAVLFVVVLVIEGESYGWVALAALVAVGGVIVPRVIARFPQRLRISEYGLVGERTGLRGQTVTVYQLAWSDIAGFEVVQTSAVTGIRSGKRDHLIGVRFHDPNFPVPEGLAELTRSVNMWLGGTGSSACVLRDPSNLPKGFVVERLERFRVRYGRPVGA